MRVVGERLLAFTEVPLGDIFVHKGCCYWKTSVTHAVTIGRPCMRERFFKAFLVVCHILL